MALREKFSFIKKDISRDVCMKSGRFKTNVAF